MGYKGEPTEILVFCKRNTLLAMSDLDYLAIHRALLKLTDRENVGSGRSQGPNGREVAALVGEKSHEATYSEVRLYAASCEMASAAYARQARISSAVSRG